MRFLAVFLLWTLALPAWGQTLPDLGGAGDAGLSPQLERRIGEAIMREIRFRDPSYLEGKTYGYDRAGRADALLTDVAASPEPADRHVESSPAECHTWHALVP